jgi:hypothetical protein
MFQTIAVAVAFISLLSSQSSGKETFGNCARFAKRAKVTACNSKVKRCIKFFNESTEMQAVHMGPFEAEP